MQCSENVLQCIGIAAQFEDYSVRHGGSQPRNDEGTSHFARRDKNAEAFLIISELWIDML